MTLKNNMKTREEIEKGMNSGRIPDYVIVELLLDIRDLLTPKEICVCTSELKCQFHSKKENHE